MAKQNLISLSKIFEIPANGGYPSWPAEGRSIPVSWKQPNGSVYDISAWSFAVTVATYDLGDSDSAEDVTAVTQFTANPQITYTVTSPSVGASTLYVPASVLSVQNTATTANQFTRLVVIRIRGTFTTAGNQENRNTYVGFRVYSDTPSIT